MRQTRHKKLYKLTAMTSMSALLTACNLDFLVAQKLQHFGSVFDDEETGIGTGYDVFRSSPGADKLNGVYGTDFHHANLIIYANSSAGVTVVLDGATKGIGGYAEGDVLTEIDDVVGSAYDDHITGNANDNELNGGAGNDTLIGLGGDDILKAGSGDNKLFGGAGDDGFSAGKGANYFNGGTGTDSVNYSHSTIGIQVDLVTGNASGGWADGDELIDIEYILATYYDDVLIGDSEDNGFTGLAGNDILDGGSGGDDILYSGPGDDEITSRAGEDDLYGGDGNDVISAGADDDRLRGGDGDDILNGGTGNDLLLGGRGVDKIILQGDGNTLIDYVIDKVEHKINISLNKGADVDVLSSIEMIEITGEYNVDVKEIWSDLAAVEQAKFASEAEFLNWLGDDIGYNYEGL